MFDLRVFKTKACGLVIIICASVFALPALSYSTRISDAELAYLFTGKDIFFDMRNKDKTQGWDSAHLRFLDDGNLVGYLFSSDLLSLKQPGNDIDNGIWEINDNMLCIHWSQWDQSQRNCYAIYLSDDIYQAKSDSQGLLKGEFDPQY